jgi:hypothetical protein
MGNECLEEAKPLYLYKDKVAILPLGMVYDLFTITTCGYKTNLMNKFINTKSAMKKLQFGTNKCVRKPYVVTYTWMDGDWMWRLTLPLVLLNRKKYLLDRRR